MIGSFRCYTSLARNTPSHSSQVNEVSVSDKKVADLYLSQFEPRPRLEVKQTNIVRPRFPVIDAHNHLAEPFGGDWEKSPLSELLNVLDQADVRFFVDLEGGWGEDILNLPLYRFTAGAPRRV